MKTCFVLRKEQDGNKVLVYIGKMNSGIRKRAQAHANKTKCHVGLFFDGRDPEVFKPA